MNNENNNINRKKEIEFRALESDGKALLDPEIVEMFLSAVHERQEAQIIAKRLIDKFGIGGILGQEMDDLRAVEGVNDSTVAVIVCLKEAAKRRPREELKKGPIMNNLETIVEYFRISIGYSEREKVNILYLDENFRLIGEVVFTGTAEKAPVYIYEITRKALVNNAKILVMSHNHPEGEAEPSDEDKVATEALAKSCSSITIRLFDHIIVTSTGYFSFREKKLL